MPLLNPCPVCGKQPVTQCTEVYPARYKLFCGVHVSCGDWFPNTEAAEKDWNRRTTDPMQPDLYKPTHADRIRAMSDEELADWLLWMQTNDISVRWCCKPECYARIERLGDEFDCTDIMVKACAVDWLKQPAEEE